MTTFDYIQFKTPREFINNPTLNKLSKSIDTEGRETFSLKTNERKKLIGYDNYDLKLVFNLDPEYATIGFSSKVLGDKYPDLINKNNIEECLNLFSEKYGLCDSIDPKAITWGKCNRLEVTKDVVLTLNTEDYQSLNNLVINTHKWKTLTNSKGEVNKNGFGSMRVNNSESVIIYGKEIEMSDDKHEEFINKNNLQGRFIGKSRIEVKLNSSKAIRNRFDKTNDLVSILNSERIPQVDILTEIFSHIGEEEADNKIGDNLPLNQRDRERLSYAKEFDFNYKKMSADIRGRIGRNFNRELEQIKRVCGEKALKIDSTIKTINQIKHLLSA
jgi:hypothetical protein